MPIQELLQKYHNFSQVDNINDLFVADPDRFQACSRQFDGLLLDFSRTSISRDAFNDLINAAGEAGLPAAIEALCSGAIVNRSENRAAWHTLVRTGHNSGEFSGLAEFATEQERMFAITKSLRSGIVPGGADGITDVVHLGIGGSAAGPMLVSAALAGRDESKTRVHYLASADGHALTEQLRRLQPQQTAFIIASKSFSTRETMLNARALKNWLVSGGVGDPSAHMLAITAARQSALEFGVADDLILKLWPEIGGRYSLWSSIGLPVAIAIGQQAYLELLAGANAMDEHFRSAPLQDNLPVLLALCGIWHRNVCGYTNLAVMPYDHRLRLLPEWLQQVDMESNGKSTDQHGVAVQHATAPVLIGGVGTTAQHSVFQALHQGTEVVPVEFIGVLKADHDLDQHHRLQLGNMLAQGEALMRGRSSAETRSYLEQCGLDSAQLEDQLPQRTFPGNRPSLTLLLDELSAYGLGQLLALFEHKVFAQSVIWGINAFDQWGVEYGKVLANRYESALESRTTPGDSPPDLLSYVQATLSR